MTDTDLEAVIDGLDDWEAGLRLIVEAALTAVESLEPGEVAAARAQLAGEDRRGTADALEPTCAVATEGSIARGTRWMTWAALVHEWEGTPALWAIFEWSEELYARGAEVTREAARSRLAEIARGAGAPAASR